MSEWLDDIRKLLKENCPGNPHDDPDRMAAWKEAIKMSRLESGAMYDALRAMFRAWVVAKGFLNPPPDLLADLPATVMGNDGKEFYSEAQRTAHQEERANRRSERVQSAIEWMLAGFDDEACVSRICSKEEWFSAVSKCKAIRELKARGIYEEDTMAFSGSRVSSIEGAPES